MTNIMDDMLYSEISSQPGSRNFLKRPRVVNLIRSAIQKPLTTVVAGAGYGKTQAVLSVLESNEYNTAWVQLSELDNHINRFWERIAYVFEAQSSVLSKKLEILGYPESKAAFDHFLHSIGKERTEEKRFVIVFDDFHYISNKTILNFFEQFISASLHNFSIVLISRNEPDFSLTGMMSKGILSRITESDLRFTKEEMEMYFHKKGIELDESMLANIYSYTDGWIVAIYLVGLSIEKNHMNMQDPILAAKINIFSLIEKEVFSEASRELQDFLIKISKLSAIPAGLLMELADNNSSLISEMTRLSLLIRYDSLAGSYRIHHLFKEFIMEKKRQPDEAAIRELHLTAANWFKKSGRKSEALIHYKECGRYDDIFDIILSFTHHVAKETADLFIKMIEAAPDEFLRQKPLMRIVRANFMFNNNKIDEAKQELLIILDEYEALPKTEENLAILGEAYIILGLISIVKQDYAFEDLFKKADACLPNGSKLVDYKLNIADGLNVCSIKESSSGELKRHQDALFHAAPYASRVMNGCGYGIETLNAAESSLYTGDLKSAEKYAYEAIYKSKKYQQYDIEYMASFVLVRIFTSRGDYVKISEILNRLRNQLQTQLETTQISNCISLYDIIRGWFYVKIGKINEVPKWIKYEEEKQKMLAPVILGREYLVRSDCLLAEERYRELLSFMKQTSRMYESRGILYATIQNKITEAIIYHYLNDHEKSIEVLNEAYELTNPNGLVMQYIEYGNKMSGLINNARLNQGCTIPKEWLDNIYTKSSSYAKQVAQTVSAYDDAHAPSIKIKK